MPHVHGIKRSGDTKLLGRGTNRIWFCDGCGLAFLWDESSRHYGSLRDIDNGDFHRVWIACSQSCGEKKPTSFPKGVRRPRVC